MSLLGRDDHQNPYAPRGSDFGLPYRYPAPELVRPVSPSYPNIIALAQVDLDQHYGCLVCGKGWSVPILSLMLDLDFRLAERIAKSFEPHVFCELNQDERWVAIGELLG